MQFNQNFLVKGDSGGDYEGKCKSPRTHWVSFARIKGDSYTFTGGRPAETLLHLVNNTGVAIDVAIAVKRDGEWVSKGWYTVKSGDKYQLKLGEYKGAIFIYGRADRGKRFWAGDSTDNFCIDTNSKFEIQQSNQARCDEADRKSVAFGRHSIGPSDTPKVITFN